MTGDALLHSEPRSSWLVAIESLFIVVGLFDVAPTASAGRVDRNNVLTVGTEKDCTGFTCLMTTIS